MADTLEITGSTSSRLDVNGQGYTSILQATGTVAATGSRGGKGDKGDGGSDGAPGRGLPSGQSATVGQLVAYTGPGQYDYGLVDAPEGSEPSANSAFNSAQANLTGSGLTALSGAVNGSNKVYTVPDAAYIPHSLTVYLNGILQVPGDAVTETTPEIGVFTFTTAPETGDQVLAVYQIYGGGGNGYSQAEIINIVNAQLANYATDLELANGLSNTTTPVQVQNAIDQRLLAYTNNEATRVLGGNRKNYLSVTVPEGQQADWAQIGQVLNNAAGSLWFKPATIAPNANTGNTSTTAYDNRADLLLAQLGYRAMHMNAQNVPTDHSTPEKATSRAFAQAMTMAVLARDQGMYAGLRDAVINKLQRKQPFSGQTIILNSFGREYDITNNATTDWGIDVGDNLAILGAVIRAWNQWGAAADKDLGSGMCYDLKNYFCNTDQGRAYLVMDETQKGVVNGHHTDGDSPIWANDLSKINPVIFRMAKTFTGDTIFDQLLEGYYDLLAKATASTGNLATSNALPPRYLYYRPADHSVGAITSGSHGWAITLTTNTDGDAMRTLAYVYEDYKMFTEARALTYLRGPVLTFFKGLYDSNSVIYTSYNHAGTAQTSAEDAYTYRVMYLLLSMATTGTTADTMKTAKIPYPTAVSGDNHYFNNQKKGVTAASTQQGDGITWLAEAKLQGLYQDLAVYGLNPNAGTTAPAGTTPVDQGGGTTTTPPASGGTGSSVGSFYAYGAAPNLTQNQRQTIARGEYDKFKALCFVNYHCQPDGTGQTTLPDGQYRVMNPFDQFNGNQSGLRACVSEGIGYGMLATVFFGNPSLPTGIKDTGAQVIFDGFWKYYKRYMNSHGLMNWCIRSDGTVNGTGGASDGDFDVAFGLVMAHRIWGSAGSINYAQEAVTLINNIRDWEFVPLSGYPNPNFMTNGDQWGFNNQTYFQDYFRPAWFREFYKHTGDTRWLDIINVNYPIAQGFFYNTGSEVSNVNGLTTDITREGKRAGEAVWGYNSIRYPFSIVADYCWNGPATSALAHDAPARLVARAKVKYGTNPTPAIPSGQRPDPYSGSSGIVAEPDIQYGYWRGGPNYYRNAAFVQAYGVAAVTDSTHAQWAADCMNWLAADTEPNYFGRSLSCISTMLMAGIMVPATPTSTGSSNTTPGTGTGGTTTTPVIVTPPTTNQPVGAYALYAHQGFQVHAYTAGLSAGTKKTRFEWLCQQPMAFWSGIEWDPNCTGAKAAIDGAEALNKVAQVLSYSIPGRDLGQFSAGGAANRDAYQVWIGKLATAIGNRKVILAYEPDSLPQSDGLPNDQRTGRYSMMAYAIKYLKQNCPNLWLYADVGHPAWRSVQDAANLLRQVGIENANGFAVNISNFRPDSECIAYGQQICAALNLPNTRFVYDTSRNGGTPPEASKWANPDSRKFGKLAQFGNTGIDKCDGYLWWKTPGESDGNNNDGWVGETAPVAGTLYPKYLYNDSVGDNITTGVITTSSGLLQRPPTPGVEIQGAQNPTY